jgi:hypothetical protein
MTTKLTLLALFALPAFAVSPPEPKPGDSVTTYLATLPKDRAVLASITPQEAARQAGLIIITKQEAGDVVKAMEILSKWIVPPSHSDSGGILTTDSVYRFIDNSPEGLRRQADVLEQRIKDEKKAADDISWARSVLEVWKAKIKEAK